MYYFFLSKKNYESELYLLTNTKNTPIRNSSAWGVFFYAPFKEFGGCYFTSSKVIYALNQVVIIACCKYETNKKPISIKHKYLNIKYIATY